MSIIKLDNISEAINDIKNGKVIIVVDDENRENEGDFVYPAEIVTPEIINFMASKGRGLICVPLTPERCSQLKLNPMVDNNTELMETAFTVSVDLKGNGVTSGISASDRSKTIKALVDDNTKPQDLAKPGHIFPLVGKPGGVLRRTGHTEAAVDLSRLAGFKPAGVVCEIMNEDGTMARLPELIVLAKELDLKIISIEDLVSFRMKNDSLIELVDDFVFNSVYGKFNLNVFNQTNNNQIHIALTRGEWTSSEPVLTRISSLGSINNILDNLISNDYHDFDRIFKKLNDSKAGIIVFINHEQETSSLLSRLKNIKENISEGKAPTKYRKMDTKDFGIGAQILHKLKANKLNLLTNSKNLKRVGLTGYGIEIIKTTSY